MSWSLMLDRLSRNTVFHPILQDTLICKCGNEFTPIRKNQKYCGRKCQKRFSRPVPKRVFPKVPCVVCGKEFDQRHPVTKTCCSEHSKIYAKQQKWRITAKGLKSQVEIEEMERRWKEMFGHRSLRNAG